MIDPATAASRAVIVISSHVVRGTVGNRAMVAALEAMGRHVWAVPTIILPWHPGHGRGTRIVPEAQSFDALMADLENAPRLGEVTAILSGYLGSPRQADAIASLVRALKARNRDALYLCDPVIGDHAGLYVPEATATAIRDRLLPLADIATPNRYELTWLAGGAALADEAALAAAARRCGPPTMLVTSAPAARDGEIANLLVSETEALRVDHPVAARPPNGTGDLIAALMLEWRLRGHDDRSALARSAGAVYDVVAAASAAGLDELPLERAASILESPRTALSPVNATREYRGGAPHPVVAGVDGCRGGWIAVIRDRQGDHVARVFARFVDLLEALPQDAFIAVDMPIGLPDIVGHGGRGPETLIRKRLGARQSSVFSIPSRAAVYAETAPFTTVAAWHEAHRRACEVARRTSDPARAVSIQAFALFPKIREIDGELIARPALRHRVIESHPEAAFWKLANDSHMQLPKKIRGTVNPAGMAERRALLRSHGITSSILDARVPGAGQDDLLDAAAMMLVAARHARGEAVSFPDPPLVDGHGIPIAIWV